MTFIPRPAAERTAAWLCDLLAPELFKEPVVTQMHTASGDWFLKRTADGAELMRLSAAECIEATETLDNWRAFWGRVKAAIGGQDGNH